MKCEEALAEGLVSSLCKSGKLQDPGGSCRGWCPKSGDQQPVWRRVAGVPYSLLSPKFLQLVQTGKVIKAAQCHPARCQAQHVSWESAWMKPDEPAACFWAKGCLIAWFSKRKPAFSLTGTRQGRKNHSHSISTSRF